MTRGALLLAAGLFLSCGDSLSGETHTVVFTELTFGVRDPDQQVDGQDVSSGLDIDGHVSTRRDVEGCNRQDFVNADGTPGIDNQFTFLFEAIEEIFPGAVEGLIQGTINEGRLLLMLRLDGVDDFQNDDHVELSTFIGEGRPDLSAADRIVPDQTFDIKADSPISRATGRIVDGVLEAGPFTFEFPVAVLNVFFDMTVMDSVLRAEISEDGSIRGIFGGGVPMEQIQNVGLMADAMQEIQISPTLDLLLPRLVDLGKGEDGRCTLVSANMIFESTPAFVFDTPAPVVEDE
ncbi:MAG: hypothetical protein AAGE52_25530 [Myxococcota bacterium]